MAKKSRKSRKSRRGPKVPAISLLRDKLDTQFNDAPERLNGESIALLLEGSPIDKAMPILLISAAHVPDALKHINRAVSEWLVSSDETAALVKLLRQHQLPVGTEALAQVWLHNAGLSQDALGQLIQVESLFHSAHLYKGTYQGMALVFFYRNDRKRDVVGIHLLLDYEEPWNGAAKDIIIHTMGSESDIKTLLDTLVSSGTPSEPISQGQAKTEILAALDACERNAITLPPEVIKNRRLFARHVFAMEGQDDTPNFTLEDFDRVSHEGRDSQTLRHNEIALGGFTHAAGGNITIE